MKRLAAAFLAMALAAGAAFSVQPGEQLPDPSQESRARRISAELRCLVCQNQSIDDSDAPLAGDLRRLVRERIVAGDSDQQISAFLVARYGEFVLLSPPFSGRTALLWLLPVLALAAGFFAVTLLFRRRGKGHGDPEGTTEGSPALSSDERKAIEALLAAENRR